MCANGKHNNNTCVRLANINFSKNTCEIFTANKITSFQETFRDKACSNKQQNVRNLIDQTTSGVNLPLGNSSVGRNSCLINAITGTVGTSTHTA